MAILIEVLLLVFMSGYAVGYKTAADDPDRPYYIPKDYIQIEAGDFDLYRELWLESERNNRFTAVVANLAGYRKPSTILDSITYMGAPADFFNNVYFIHNEDRYYVTIVRFNGVFTQFVTHTLKKSESTTCGISGWHFLLDDKPPKEYESLFMCDHWYIVNSTHAIDTIENYNKILNITAMMPPKNNESNTISFGKAVYQPIVGIPEDSCINGKIRKQLDQCFNGKNYCTVDSTRKEPQLILTKEKLAQFYNQAHLIPRFDQRDDNNMTKFLPYYILQYKNLNFYFPLGLNTYKDKIPPDTQMKRHSLIPKFQEYDAFWTRLVEIEKEINRKNESSPYDHGNIFINSVNIYAQNMYVNDGYRQGPKLPPFPNVTH